MIADGKVSTRWKLPSEYYTHTQTYTDDQGNVGTIQFVFIDTVMFAGNTYDNPSRNNSMPPPGPKNATAAATQLEVQYFPSFVFSVLPPSHSHP